MRCIVLDMSTHIINSTQSQNETRIDKRRPCAQREAYYSQNRHELDQSLSLTFICGWSHGTYIGWYNSELGAHV